MKKFCADWLKVRKPELRPESVKLYKNTIERLLNYFGEQILLHKITPSSAARFIAEQKRLDSKDAELSNWSRHKALRHCKTMFQTAVVWELIPKSPFTNVKAPKLVLSRWYYLTLKDYKKLLGVAPSLRWKALYALAYTGGLRFGELVSLTWDDLDFKTGEVKVQNRLASATMPPFHVKDCESRTISLPEHTLGILEDLRTYYAATDEETPYVLLNQRQYKTAVKKWQIYKQQKRAWRNQDMINNTWRSFERHLKRAKIKANGTLSIHTLRKSCIQNWANMNPNPKVTQRLAGHADLKTTMQFYCKVSKVEREQAAHAIDMLLEKADV